MNSTCFYVGILLPFYHLTLTLNTKTHFRENVLCRTLSSTASQCQYWVNTELKIGETIIGQITKNLGRSVYFNSAEVRKRRKGLSLKDQLVY